MGSNNNSQSFKQDRLRQLMKIGAKIGATLSAEKELNALVDKILSRAHDLFEYPGVELYLLQEKPVQNKNNVVSLQ